MADDPGKPYRDKLNAAADKALEVYDRNKRYKPSRETDKYILDRAFENIPGMRPSNDPRVSAPIAPTAPIHQSIFSAPPSSTPLDFAINTYFRDMGGSQSQSNRVKAARQLQKDLDIVNHPDNKTYHTNRKEWDEAVQRLRKASKQVNSVWSSGPYSWDASLPMSAADKQHVQDLESELAELYTAPGAQVDRPGRLQEIKESLDITDPDSAIRAGLRELKRKMVDDQVPRIKASYKTQTGEEFMLSKLKELGLSDTPATRGVILTNLGMSKLPEKVRIQDDAGNPVPLYVDEMKAAREAAAEKAYMSRRRDPMKDTPERD